MDDIPLLSVCGYTWHCLYYYQLAFCDQGEGCNVDNLDFFKAITANKSLGNSEWMSAFTTTEPLQGRLEPVFYLTCQDSRHPRTRTLANTNAAIARIHFSLCGYFGGFGSAVWGGVLLGLSWDEV
jgi:hypothetical protein